MFHMEHSVTAWLNPVPQVIQHQVPIDPGAELGPRRFGGRGGRRPGDQGAVAAKTHVGGAAVDVVDAAIGALGFDLTRQSRRG
jgi:hypothetical protein